MLNFVYFCRDGTGVEEEERIDGSKLGSVKFQFKNLERRSVIVPKFGTSIRIDVKITMFRHALVRQI